ncbi:MAG: BON domain-containing protein [Pseudomonadota bacterium]
MTLTHQSTRTLFTAGRVRTTLLVAALLGSSMLAVAADETAAAPTGAASKAEGVASDSWITTKVKSELLANSLSKGFKVSVTTKQGAVALEGKLPNQDAIELVKTLTEKVQGVKSVDASGLVVGG